MGSLLDTLGAIVLAALFILTVYNATFNLQATAYDNRMQATLTKVSEKVVDALDSYYLSKVGAGVYNNQIIIAEPNRFKFRGRFLEHPNRIDVIEIVQGDSISGKGFPLEVYKNDQPDLGPFWLSKPANFTYYDAVEEETTDRNDIYSMKCELDFFYKSFTEEMGISILKNKIVFWQYFKNLYLQ
ncbi:MAG: hypothetical protein SVM86_00715 [Candidatus Cloacimonadota bacterium]|nr:hypothetical protein [Candidatus Cloacimonadota bacterium]